ncbi:formyl-coenzyme A transferase [compost metagenome]
MVTTPHPVLGEVKNMAMPVRFQNAPRQARLAPPLLGEHTCDVLTELGFDNDEIQDMLEAGTVSACEPAHKGH